MVGGRKLLAVNDEPCAIPGRAQPSTYLVFACYRNLLVTILTVYRIADRGGCSTGRSIFCQVKLASACDTSRLKETTYKRTESVQAGNPLLIRTKLRESRSKVIADKRISLLERIYSETALHQSDSNNFGIRESRLVIRRGSPMRQLSMGFKEVINKDVDLSHLIYNGRQMGRPPSAGLSFATTFYTSSELWRPILSTPYSG